MKDILGNFNLYLLIRMSTNTVLSYTYDLEQFADFCKKNNIALEKITIKDLKAYLSQMVEKGLSVSTRCRKINSLKAFLVYSFPDNPALHESLVMPKAEKKLPKVLCTQSIYSLLVHANRQTDRHALRTQLIINLLYTTGIRVSELCSLTVENIYLLQQYIKVMGKGRKERFVPLTKEVGSLIERYLATYHADFRTRYQNTPYLFPSVYGNRVGPLSRQAVMILIKKIGKKAGINQAISPHQLRHSFATHLLYNGANLRQIQTILGHERVTSTQIYTHLDMRYLRKEYDKKHPRA